MLDRSDLLPALDALRRRRSELLQAGPLLGERAREIQPRQGPATDQHLSERLTALLLRLQRLFELGLVDEASLDEDLADAPAARRRPARLIRLGPADPESPLRSPCVRLLELGPLLGEHAGELDPRDVELGDQDLAQEHSRLGLELEGTLELLVGQKPTLDEEGADQPRLQDRCLRHATCIGNPSFGL